MTSAKIGSATGCLLGLLFLLVAASNVGAGPQFRQTPGKATEQPSAAAGNASNVAPEDGPISPGTEAGRMVCSKCRSYPVLRPTYGYPARGPVVDGGIPWVAVGTEHTCKRCSGLINTAKDETIDTMGPGCRSCGTRASLCNAAAVEADREAPERSG